MCKPTSSPLGSTVIVNSKDGKFFLCPSPPLSATNSDATIEHDIKEDQLADMELSLHIPRPSSPTSVSDCDLSTPQLPVSSLRSSLKRSRDFPGLFTDSPPTSSVTLKSVTFPKKVVSEIRTRPFTDEEDVTTLFYTTEELTSFREEYRNILRAARLQKQREGGILALSSIAIGRLYDMASSYIHEVIVAGGKCQDDESTALVDTLYRF